MEDKDSYVREEAQRILDNLRKAGRK
jgi:3-methyladenine DNA glycosylase AlkC